MGYYDDERNHDHYDIHNYDIDGWPGEYIIGPDMYYDDYYMDERWLPVKDFPDYWVSNKGRLYSTRTDRFIDGSPVGRCGHIDISIKYGSVRYHKYLHRLVAEAFIPNPNNYPEVRHMDDNPNNNCVENLKWGTQADNVRDCITSGRFRYFTPEDIEAANEKRRTPIKAIKLSTGEKYYFHSQQEAARRLGINSSDISSVVRGKNTNARGYYFYYADEEPKIDINDYKYSRHRALIKATDLRNGDIFYFRGQTEAARELNLSVASVSMVVRGKWPEVKGYTFEYVDEGECDYGDY